VFKSISLFMRLIFPPGRAFRARFTERSKTHEKRDMGSRGNGGKKQKVKKKSMTEKNETMSDVGTGYPSGKGGRERTSQHNSELGGGFKRG